MSELLRVRDLHVALPVGARTVEVVRGVSLHLAKATTLAVVGESGSGKTMTALAVLGLVPNAQVTGSIEVAGVRIEPYSQEVLAPLRGRVAGMVFQDPQSALHPALRVGEQLRAVVRQHSSATKASAHQRCLELLAEVGIADGERCASAYPHELSGGLRQRIAIAMALAGNPEVLIADEPTTALDVTVQAKVLGLLRTLSEQRGLALLLISHDLGVVAAAADRIAVMYAGRIVEDGPTAQVLANPRHPYTAALTAAIPRVDAAPRTAPLAIPGEAPLAGAIPPGCPFHPRCASALPECRVSEPPLRAISAEHAAACVLVEARP
jgi:oligopeptide/dipeptide ABC transporter ATP-binding protein